MLHTRKHIKLLWLTATTILVVAATTAMSFAAQGSSVEPAQTPMPPRPPTATPRAHPTATPVGAAIILQVQPASAATGLWSIVQWQGSDGAWHDVEGWRGAPDAAGHVRWWVAPYNSSRAEFRWVIYPDTQHLAALAFSEVFSLPDEPAETVVRRIVLGEGVGEVPGQP